MRGIFIFAGVAVLERFDWILYVFGGFLKLVRRFVPTTADDDGQKLFTRENGRRLATPLSTVLVPAAR